MKNILLTLLLVILWQVINCQVIEFISIDSTVKGSKQELFIRAKSWLVNTFKSANDVIQLEDKETGKIIGKANFGFEGKSMGIKVSDDVIWFTS